jgi:hypothetical protein
MSSGATSSEQEEDGLSLDGKHAAKQQRSAGYLRTSATAMTGPGGRAPMRADHPDLKRITSATITATAPRRSKADLACWP